MEIGPQTDTLPTRASLLARLRNLDDSRSWKEFFERYEQKITWIARSRGLKDFEAEEVAQEVFKRVAWTICRYQTSERPGSFRRWLFNLTRWRVTDQLRERARDPLSRQQNESHDQNRANNLTPAIERVPVPSDCDALFEAEARRHTVDTLLKSIESSVTAKQLQIFQLLVLDEAEPAEVAKLYGMTLAAVYVTKHRVEAKLRKEISHINLPLE